MRLIGKLANQQQAENFSAFLTTVGIQTHIEPENDAFEIWIKDEDKIHQASAELAEFQADPQARRYTESKAKARKLQEDRIKKQRQIAKNVVVASDRFGRRRQPLVIFLIVACGLIGVLTNFGDGRYRKQAAFRSLAFMCESSDDVADRSPDGEETVLPVDLRLASIARGEVWRLVTPIFLHFGIFHLIFNMYWLYILGGQIENRYGTFWFGMLVLVAAAISNFFQCMVPESIGGSVPARIGDLLMIQLGGMSGVNYALFGFIWMRMTYDRSSGLFLSQGTIIILMGFLVFCMTPLAAQVGFGNVANWAHAIGLLVGVIAGYWPMIWSYGSAGKPS